MVCDSVHGHRKGKDVTSHNENDQQKLTGSQELAPELAEKDLAGIGHALDVRIAPSELSNGIASISRQKAEAEQKNNSTFGECQYI